MILELPCNEFEKVRNFKEGLKYNNRVLSHIEGYRRGTVCVDTIERPHTAIAWVKDMFYLACDGPNSEFLTHFNTSLSIFFQMRIIYYYTLFFLSEALFSRVERIQYLTFRGAGCKEILYHFPYLISYSRVL